MTKEQIQSALLALSQEIDGLTNVEITTFEEANNIRILRENAQEKMRLLQAQITILLEMKKIDAI